MEQYSIELINSEYFECCHFISFEGFREYLHGHTYFMCVKLVAEKLDSKKNIVFGFNDVRRFLKNIKEKYHNSVLLPKLNKTLKIENVDDNIVVHCEDRSVMSFPSSDVRILEVDQISAECLSKFFAHLFLDYLKEFNLNIKKLKFKVSESHDQVACYGLKFN